jgi:hypothetical protein
MNAKIHHGWRERTLNKLGTEQLSVGEVARYVMEGAA